MPKLYGKGMKRAKASKSKSYGRAKRFKKSKMTTKVKTVMSTARSY